jgi:excisionase family DNA binding protein
MKKHFWDDGPAVKIKHPEESVTPSIGLITRIDQIEPLYTVEEAAKILRVEVSTVYKFKCQGIIEATKQGRNIFFTAQQIADCRKRRQQQWQRRKAR